MATNRLLAHSRRVLPRAPAASRASWIGTLKVADLSVPVKAFSTIDSNSASQLCHVHRGCGHRISYCKTCSVHGAVTAEEIGKAYQYSNDCLVELSHDELAELTPTDDKTIKLERFFPGDQLDLALLAGRSLFLSPASLAAGPAFALIRAALEEKQMWALGQTVLSQRLHLVVVHPAEGALLLHTLHDPLARRACVPLNTNGTSPSRTSVRTLSKVIDKASGPFDLSGYHDDSGDKLLSLIQSKLTPADPNRNKHPVANRNANDQELPRRRKLAKAA
ncbi:MAG: hypothetical protein H6821_17060 [Planctomycetaceae bacterium]|nr:hypothetical protein [Planctomycetales bacterium]MCB9875879.1 hypothetical protein [Planctomycetaceae bacterium]MCB9941252.1 hypothetical protein [Planctomycetaceae bacterium]